MNDENKIPKVPPTAHVTKYMWRGVQYASISACTILAGYFMQPQKTLKNDLLLLSIPIIASVYFFIRYANRFHPSDSSTVPGDEIGTAFQSEAVRLYFYFVLIPYTAFVLYYVSRTEILSYHLLSALFLYVCLFIYYSKFLINYKSDETLPLVRHWLIWPVVLSIGIGLYYGLSFSALKDSFLPLTPVGIIILLYLASFKLSRRWYLGLALLVTLSATIFSFFIQLGYFPSFENIKLSSMLFCLASAAYLAVFEAGRITSDIAKAEHVDNSLAGRDNQVFSSDRKAFRYAQATLVALTASVGVLPFYYIFSGYGSPFLIGFAIHAFVAFIFWFYFGKTPFLQRWGWSLIKIVAGIFFLLLLVLSPTKFFNEQFTFRFMKGFAGWIGIPILMVIVFILIGKLLKDFDELRREGKVAPIYELFKERINFTRMLSLLCLIFCLIITFLLQSINEVSPQYSRAELAFQVYAICIFLCFVVEAVEYLRQKPQMSQKIKSILGIFLVVRIFTSVMIALVVILPFINSGLGIMPSILSALPFFLSAAGGFAINDYYDVAKDTINKPYRAIPSGKMKPETALVIGIVLLGLSLSLSLIVSKSSFELLLYLVSLAGVVTYNFFVKYLAVSKTFLTAAISTLPVLYVVTALSYKAIYLLIPISSMIFLLGRELLMDIRDMNGDRTSGIRTLPMIIGARLTAKIGFSLLIFCGAILFLFTANVWSIQNLFFSCLIIISSLFMSLFWSYGSGKYQRLIIISLYLPMLCGIFMLLK
jgi:geranylgeranylglycerol-phosphate geranylgeranyltransferase